MMRHKPWGLVLGLVLSVLITSMAYGALGDRLLARGMNGSDVSQLQTKLAQLGYAVGSVDGKFGPKTQAAVRKFQQDRGLKVDGIAGPQTVKELNRLTGQSTNASGKSVGNKNVDTNLLAHLIHGEARGEPYLGQVAVGAVVMNRITDSNFPNTVAEIIYQPGAFSCVPDGQINLAPDASAIRAAQEAASGVDPSQGALFFFNPAKTSNKFIWSRPQILKIGNHIFTR